jgi:hypothetical protein
MPSRFSIGGSWRKSLALSPRQPKPALPFRSPQPKRSRCNQFLSWAVPNGLSGALHGAIGGCDVGIRLAATTYSWPCYQPMQSSCGVANSKLDPRAETRKQNAPAASCTTLEVADRNFGPLGSPRWSVTPSSIVRRNVAGNTPRRNSERLCLTPTTMATTADWARRRGEMATGFRPALSWKSRWFDHVAQRAIGNSQRLTGNWRRCSGTAPWSKRPTNRGRGR